MYLGTPLPAGHTGISHTCWATHGRPGVANCHPHLDTSGRVAVVHNGIIENYRALRKQLIDEGVVFCSETDSEVVAQLLATIYAQLFACYTALMHGCDIDKPRNLAKSVTVE